MRGMYAQSYLVKRLSVANRRAELVFPRTNGVELVSAHDKLLRAFARLISGSASFTLVASKTHRARDNKGGPMRNDVRRLLFTAAVVLAASNARAQTFVQITPGPAAVTASTLPGGRYTAEAR